MSLNLIPKIFIVYALGAQLVFVFAMMFNLYDEKDQIPKKAFLSWLGFIMVLTLIYKKRRGINEKD